MQSRSASADIVAARYASLLDLGRILTGIITPEDLLPAFADRANSLLPAQTLLVSTCHTGEDRATVIFRSDARTPGAGASSYPGSSCTAIRDRRPVLHFAGDAAAAALAESIDCRDRPALCAPILREGRTLGSVTALGAAGTAYGSPDLDFLAGLADLLARSPLFGTAEDEADRQFNTIADRVLAAIAALRTEDALEQATSAAREITAADGAQLWIARAGGELQVEHATGIAHRRGERVPPSHDIFRILAEATAPILLDSPDPHDSPDLHGLVRVRPSLIAPLVADGRVLGAVCVAFNGRNPAPLASRQLQRLASLAAVAAAHARLHEQIGALALLDPLTGIPNRRHLALYLEKEFAAARRGRRLTVLLFEIDGFDAFGRDRGRTAADAALRAFGEILVQQTRAMNLAARFDDNAFVVALADADRRAGFIHASRIARAIEAHSLLGPAGIHASVGIASFSPRLTSFEDLLRGARKDLDARRAGAGRLTL